MKVRAIGIIIFILSIFAVPSFSTTYRITDLGTFRGASACAYGINSSGEVVGSYTDGGVTHAFLYTPGVGVSDLGALPGYANSVAYGINSNREVVGYCSNGDVMSQRGFLWKPGQGMTALLPAGHISSLARAINSSGQVAGWYQDNQWDFHPFVYTPGSGLSILNSPERGPSIAMAINDSGLVAGGSLYRACLYTPTSTVVDLGSLGGASRARGINRDGWVAGYSDLTENPYGGRRAFLYRPGFGMMDLGGLGGNSEAYAINSSGVVVGYYWGGPFAYTTDGGMVNIGSLTGTGWSGAYAINDAGYIVGQSKGHAVIWEPVPEPSGLMAICIGLVSVAGLVCRRKRN